jgi:hypothetical protein
VLSLRRGRVTGVVERHPGLVRLEVDGRPCIAYPGLTGPVCVGDDVVVNVQAVELGLGSGGFDVLHANLTRGLGRPPRANAHVMALPYTSLQHARRHAEEDAPAARDLDGMPVVLCTLHSQVAPACAGIGAGPRVAYVQVEGGALPLPLSDAVRTLRRARLLETTAAVGSCVGGDVACVTVAAALAWARGTGHDAVLCAIGPGVVGTGSELGHGALRLADAANAAIALGGRPVLAARLATRDERARHEGVSHHTLAVVRLARPGVVLAWPSGAPMRPPRGVELAQVTVDGWEGECAGLPLESMGRGADEEPWLFAAAFAAGRAARSLLDASR